MNDVMVVIKKVVWVEVEGCDLIVCFDNGTIKKFECDSQERAFKELRCLSEKVCSYNTSIDKDDLCIPNTC